MAAARALRVVALLLASIPGFLASSGQGYQQYMQQYADKYMSKTSGDNSSGSSSAQGYQQYMKQYADKYMGSKGGNSSGSGGDYQKYMSDYADKYMNYAGNSTGHSDSKNSTSDKGAGSAQDYQKYMHQYAGKYMGGASANPTELAAVKASNSSGGGAGQDYQQYVHQYADQYMGGAGHQQGAGAGTGWQSFVKKYAGGAGEQQAGNSMNYPIVNHTLVNDLYQSLDKHNATTCATWQCLCTWRNDQVSIVKATVPAMYSAFSISGFEKQYKDLLAAFAAKSSTTVDNLGLSAACQPKAAVTALAARPSAASKASTASSATGATGGAWASSATGGASAASRATGENLSAPAPGPRGGMVLLVGLLGLSLPALASLAGGLLRRRRKYDLHTQDDVEGTYYEAIA